jgi:hypothetical protein
MMTDYWMRWVNFAKLRGLMALIVESPGDFTPAELDRAAVSAGILLSSSGKPLGPSSRYHYRRILEKLAMVKRVNGRYIATLDPSENASLSVHLDHPELDDDQRYVFGNRVILNKDCYDAFWRVFSPEKRPDSLHEFIKLGGPIVLVLNGTNSDATSEHRLTLRHPLRPDSPVVHQGYKAVEAIHFGMRAWGVDQLRFLDELYRVGEGYQVFPREIQSRIGLKVIERALVGSIEFHGDWAMPRISDLLLSVASEMKVALLEVRMVLEEWVRHYPGYVTPVATSDRMILAGQSAQMKRLILTGFLTLPSGEHVSHLQVHRGLLEGLTHIT